MRVAVVGGGIVGLSACRSLAERGHRVVLFEQFQVGHDAGSSHGHSRIVRKAYPDPFYTGIMVEGYPLWRELQDASGIELLHECGLAYFGSAGSETLKSVVDGLIAVGEPVQVLKPAESKTVFPALRLEADEVNVFTPQAGWVHADLAVRATRDLAVAAGAEIREGVRAGMEEIASHDAFIVSPGAWITDFVPLNVQVTCQTFAYVQHDQDGPVWIEDSEDFAYGFPAEGRGAGFKVGVHRHGRPIEADGDRYVDPAMLAIIEDVARRRFDVDEPILAGAKTCLYTNTPDEDFRIGRIGDSGFFASPCSGHGFKFGPWFGRMLADFVEGRDQPEDHPRFFQEF